MDPITDGEIYLSIPDWHEGEEELFEIRLNQTDEVVGNIRYYYDTDYVAGNVSYEIYEEYRGKRYATKALRLLARNISNLDDKDLFISILPDNRASIKTAKGAGALFYKQVDIPKNYCFSKEGKYTYAYMYIIENDRGVNDEKFKSK